MEKNEKLRILKNNSCFFMMSGALLIAFVICSLLAVNPFINLILFIFMIKFLTTGIVAYKKDKKCEIQRKEIFESLSFPEEENIEELEDCLEKNNDYTKVASNFLDYCSEKRCCNNYSVDLLYKIVNEMHRSGYNNDSIAEYLVSIMYETKDDRKLPEDLKLIKKLK